MPAILETHNLSKAYGPFGALHGLSISVPEGSVYALMGASGAGKTTTIKLLLNILPASAGTASLLGVDSRDIGPGILSRIGYVSENQALPARLRVAQFFDYLRPCYPRWDQSLEQELRASFRLPPARRIGALSHGMRLKLALATALPFRPELLILDEPLSGLDALARDEIIGSFIGRDPAMTILISSHELDEVERLATHVAFLHEGRLLFQGSVAQLQEHARSLQPPPSIDAAGHVSLRAVFIAMARTALKR